MLLNKYRKLASPIADTLAGRNMELSVVEGSPLAALLQVSYSPDFGDVTGVNPAGIDEHDTVLMGAIKLGTETVRNSIYRARNVVRPIVNEIHEEISKQTETAVLNQMQYTITPVGLPGVYDVPALTELVKGYSNMLPLKEPIPANLIPSLTAEELERFSKANVSTIDLAAAGMFEAEPGLRTACVDYVFSPYAAEHEYSETELVASFLIARSLHMNQDEWDGTKSAALKVHLAGVAAVLGTKIKTVLAKRETARARKAVVVGLNGKEIKVNNLTYNDYLNNGGSADVIIGSVLSSDTVGTVASLTANADKYLKTYKHYVLTSVGNAATVKRDIMLRIIRTIMTDVINTDEVFKLKSGDYIKSLRDATERDVINTNDPYPYILRLVCNVLYSDTDALKVLSGIDELTASDSSVDARQAASVIFHRMLVDWLMSQVTVDYKRPEPKAY